MVTAALQKLERRLLKTLFVFGDDSANGKQKFGGRSELRGGLRPTQLTTFPQRVLLPL
ncbi:MAG: hypothetical protein KME40_03300 [Komarekiella atlantica HA4396-MV6]|nr:hypothetical protein [Komarekiella atlantica HA4396-MV6]